MPTKILPALGHAVSGSAGTAISTCITYPLSLVITRLQVQRQLRQEGALAADEEYRGILDAFSQICAREGGPAALYIGLTQDATKSILDSFLFFLFYNYFRSKRLHSRAASGKALNAWEELAVGAVAGACSRVFTTPISNVVTRKQTASLVSSDVSPKDASVTELMSAIRNEKGVVGLWSGYSASMILTLNPGITFFLQEFLKKSLLPKERWDHPGSHMTFLLPAVSKAVASTITYPFQIAKARLQAGTTGQDQVEGDPATYEKKTQVVEQTIECEADKKLKALQKVQKLAQQNILGTILHIVRTEGVGALYDGIIGELLKGFFSHGTTMLAKDIVHKLIIQLYFAIATLLRKQTAGESRPSSNSTTQKSAFRQRLLTRAATLVRNLSHGAQVGEMAPDGNNQNYVANIVDGTQRNISKD